MQSLSDNQKNVFLYGLLVGMTTVSTKKLSKELKVEYQSRTARLQSSLQHELNLPVLEKEFYEEACNFLGQLDELLQRIMLR